MKYKVTKNWQIKKLGEVCEIKSGKNQKNVVNPNGKYPIYGSSGIFGYADEYICDENTTIIGRKGTINSPIYVTTKFWNVDTAFGLCVKENLNSKFLYYFCLSFNFKKLDKSTTIPSLSKGDLLSIELPVPPIEIQLEVVSKIEALFSDIDKGIDDLKIAQQQLNTYHQSVLKWAFEGKLTNENVKNGELMKGWKLIKLGDIANAVDPQPSHRTPPVVESGIPFVSIKDFNSKLDTINFTSARKVSKTVLVEHLNRYTLENGDFVIGKIGTIGKPVRLVLPQTYCLSANIVLIQPRKINSTYLFYYFQSSSIERAFAAGAKATSQAAFGIQKVRELMIRLPENNEQIQIVEEIESRLSVVDKMEESIKESLQQAEALRQSILKMALGGELL